MKQYMHALSSQANQGKLWCDHSCLCLEQGREHPQRSSPKLHFSWWWQAVGCADVTSHFSCLQKGHLSMLSFFPSLNIYSSIPWSCPINMKARKGSRGGSSWDHHQWQETKGIENIYYQKQCVKKGLVMKQKSVEIRLGRIERKSHLKDLELLHIVRSARNCQERDSFYWQWGMERDDYMSQKPQINYWSISD